MNRILAGDIGGTHTRLSLYDVAGGALKEISTSDSKSSSWNSLEEAVAAFLAEKKSSVQAACFGVAGAVQKGVSHLTNLTWTVDAARLSQTLGQVPVRVVNDLEAVALGLQSLQGADLVSLNDCQGSGTLAVIAAGTGLGQATVHVGDYDRRIVIPSEGGHASLAAVDNRQVELLQYFIGNNIEPSWESVLSGNGIVRIHEFVRHRNGENSEPAWLVEARTAGEAPPAAVCRMALTGADKSAVEALQLFVQYYGNQAANLALTVMATGGVFIAGGIAPKIQPFLLRDGAFMKAFVHGRQKNLLAAMPVHLVVHANPGMLGAATCAAHTTVG